MVRVLVSVVERDAPARDLGGTAGGELLLDSMAHALQAAGLQVTECRAAAAPDVVALGSSWARRLGVPERRPARLLIATKPRR